MRRPTVLTGALVGLLITVPLAALLFLAQRALGAPFVPFDLFDALARVLPGAVVTFGLDAMIDLILTLGMGPVDEVAKAAEATLAVALFLLGGAVAGAAMFGAVAGRGGRFALFPSLLLGGVLGVVAFAVALGVNPVARERPLATGLWFVLAFLVWGLALGRSHDRLAALAPEAADARTERDGTTPAPADGEAREARRLDRRRFLVRLGGATALITVAGAGIGALLRTASPEAPGPAEAPAAPDAPDGPAPARTAWSERNVLPNADADLRPAPGTRPEFTALEDHYRVDINLIPPSVDAGSWRLHVDGLVREPISLTLDDLRAYEPLHQFVTLSCVSNRLGGDLIGTQRWTGVPLQRLLPDLGLDDAATHLRISSVDGFHEVVPIATALVDERVMLTYAWDGLPLPERNGFPLRIYVPDLYGMKQPKWIDRIEAIDEWREGYWVERGWDAEARIHTTSTIDTVAVDAAYEDDDGTTRVPIGGIAHGGARGISRVELRVDDGDWHEARVRTPLAETTWVVWRYDWPFREGMHTFTVRCVDGRGEPQVAEPSPIRPDGATGLVRREVRL